MADILISQLPAATPLLTDLLIFANPTTGLAKKTTLNTLKYSFVFTLQDLDNTNVASVVDNQVLYFDSGEWKNTSLKTINGNSLIGAGNITIASGITTLNTLTASTQTFATSSTGTDFTITSATSTHTFNLPSASASARGLLSSANWTSFNNKIDGSGTTNYLAKFTASGTIGNSQIIDNGSKVKMGTNLQLGGTISDVASSFVIDLYNSANYRLQTYNGADFLINPLGNGVIIGGNSSFGNGQNLNVYGGIATDTIRANDLGLSSNNFRFTFDTDGAKIQSYSSKPLILNSLANNVFINRTTDDGTGAKLQVNGKARFANEIVSASGFSEIYKLIITQELYTSNIILSTDFTFNYPGGGTIMKMYGDTHNVWIGQNPYNTTDRLTVQGDLSVIGSGYFTKSTNGASSLFIANTANTPLMAFNANGGLTVSTIGCTGGAIEQLNINNLVNNSYSAINLIVNNTTIASATSTTFLINTTSQIASSILTIDSTTKGILIPRMTTTQINAITSPATGLEVYNTTLQQPCFYDGTGWKRVSHSNM